MLLRAFDWFMRAYISGVRQATESLSETPEIAGAQLERCIVCVRSLWWSLPVCGWYKVKRASCVKVITTSFATRLRDPSCVPWINRNWFATTPYHSFTAPPCACRTTSAPVSTTRTSAVRARRSSANILKAIPFLSLSTRTAAITP